MSQRKKSFDRQIIALFLEVEVAESNGNVRILTGSWEIAVCTHAQYMSGQKQLRTTGATSGGLKLQYIHNCHLFFNSIISCSIIFLLLQCVDDFANAVVPIHIQMVLIA